MTIKKALKEKNRIAKEIASLYAIAQSHNSIEKGNVRKYNVTETLEKAFKLTNELIDLKTKIHKANLPVYDKIFRMSELKTNMGQVDSIGTNEGKVRDHFRETESVLEVEIDILKKDEMVKAMQKEIDDIQDQLDMHNATTEI